MYFSALRRRLGFGFLLLAQGLVFLTGGLNCPAQEKAAATKMERWTQPFEPFHILGPIYWVGTYDLSTYLIVTPAGNILINTGIGDTAQEIAGNVAKLGFKISDTKILTATHGHYDHVFGLAALKRMTGAQVIVSERDRELLETGGRADFHFGQVASAKFEPVKVDRTFKDGGKIALGGVELTARLHPGHTKGATSFTLMVQENGRTYSVLIANMPTINPGVNLSNTLAYPEIAQDYARTIAAQKEMKIDVWLASHASQFHLHEKYKSGDPYRPDRFVDPKGFLDAVRGLEKAYRYELAIEKEGQPPEPK